MKNSKKLFIFLITIILLIINMNTSLAQSQMQIITNTNIIKKGEELKLQIEVKDVSIASMTLEIYLDKTKLEYKKGPENTNDAGDRILYTWVNDKGENSNNIITDEFVFQGLEDGTTNIVVTGDFYNSSGQKIEIKSDYLEIQVGEKNKEIEQIENQENVADNNAKLSILRLDKEGISPEFDKNIKEYYFIADESISKLEVTAIPENSGATVSITGNNNLKIGLNTINIKITSKDQTQTEEYKIYVTKTNDVKKANANLENLAVEQATLVPEFDSDITEYKIDVDHNIDKLKILAVPQNQKATVKITGAENLVEGDNKIEIIVLAEGGITNKKYKITAHRKTEVEEIQEQEEEKTQAEKLSAILEEQANTITKEEQELQSKEAEETQNKTIIIVLSILAIVVIGMIIIYIIKRTKII